jgi:tRNA (mo5U34)-methyltransferase
MSQSSAAVEVSQEEAQRIVDAVPHWHHNYEIVPGVWPRRGYDPRPMLDRMNLPERLDGMTVLDIGCYDGFFTFELERRGAQVTSIDVSGATDGFKAAHALRGSRVEHFRDNVYDLTPERYGRHDIVLLLGVIYHLRHPLLGIDVASRLCKDDGLFFVETHGLDDAFIMHDGSWESMDDRSLRITQFYPGRELSGDESNWWAPSLAALEAMVETALFRIEDGCIWSPGRILVRGRRALETELTHYPSGNFLTDSCCYFPPGVAPRPVMNDGPSPLN